jgi:hypothetical protein
MKKIQINFKQTIIIDNEDYEKVSKHSWSTSWSEKKQRFCCPSSCINYKSIILSRFLINAPSELQVDHINKDVFDNRKINLRICNNSINGHNRNVFKKNKLKVAGVYFDKYHKKFRAEIQLNGKKIMLGYFSELKRASDIYQQTKVSYLGRSQH